MLRKPDKALTKVNKLLQQLDQPQLDSLPQQDTVEKPSVFTLTSAPLRTATLLLWCAFFMVMLSFYFVLSWTPTLLADAGLRVEEGISGAVLMNIGGVIGGVSLGYLSSRFSPHKLTGLYMILCALFMTVFGLLEVSVVLMLLLGFVIGFFVFGSMIGLYSIAPGLYGTAVRNTGMGWAIGIGRIGAIIGPSAAGLLLARGWTGADCFLAFSVPLLIAMVAVLLLKTQIKESKGSESEISPETIKSAQ